MNSIWLLLGTLSLYAIGYRFYGRFLGSRIYRLDPSRQTPAHARCDGTDYVPARNWLVLFGHHFSAICGAGPIIGPVLACAYWGWGFAFVWVLVGSVLMGAVADFSSLVVSVRAGGISIAEVARKEISPRARLLFSVFIWLALILVVAVFSIFTAKTFVEEPDAALPSLGLIPVAVILGRFLYIKKTNSTAATIGGLAALAVLLIAGRWFPVTIPNVLGLAPETWWILILLFYCAVASVTPIQMLLQPRDFLASFVLFFAIFAAAAGVFITRPHIQGGMFYGFVPSGWKEAGPLWPMLFVTVACGAISGFHSIVSSGTTSKQLGSEAHACRIGYGGMLTEGLVGVLTVICAAAGLSELELSETLRSGGPIVAYSKGYGFLSSSILGSYGRPFAVLALNAFVLTTLDAATRIARYLTEELFGIKNKYASTLLVVLLGGGLALTGQWVRLWPAFGTANQLIAAMALLVAACWLFHRGRNFWFVLIPSVIMFVTTMGAFVYQFSSAMSRNLNGTRSPDYFIAFISAALFVIAGVVVFEAVAVFRKRLGERLSPRVSSAGSAGQGQIPVHE